MKLPRQLLSFLILIIFLLVLNYFYNFFLLQYFRQTNSFLIKLVSIKYFSFTTGPWQIYYNTSLLVMFVLITILFNKKIYSYRKRLLNSLKVFGIIPQHYLIFSIITLFVTSYFLNKHTYQRLFVKEGDFIIIFISILIIISFIPIFKLVKSKEIVCEDPNEEFEEKAIANPDQDLIGFENEVSEISNYAASRHNGCDASTILIMGDWGSGKTSILNLVSYKIEKEKKGEFPLNYNKIKTIYFNVSEYEDINGLVTHFYNKILDVISEDYLLPFLDRFKILQSILLTFGKDVKPNILMNIFFPLLNTEDYLKCISHWLYLMDRRIVVLLDDIDRLNPNDEVKNIFKLLRIVNYNMKNILIVAVSDQITLVKYSKEYILV